MISIEIKKKNFVIGEIKQIHKKKIPKIEPESVIVSIQEIDNSIIMHNGNIGSYSIIRIINENKVN